MSRINVRVSLTKVLNTTKTCDETAVSKQWRKKELNQTLHGDCWENLGHETI